MKESKSMYNNQIIVPISRGKSWDYKRIAAVSIVVILAITIPLVWYLSTTGIIGYHPTVDCVVYSDRGNGIYSLTVIGTTDAIKSDSVWIHSSSGKASGLTMMGPNEMGSYTDTDQNGYLNVGDVITLNSGAEVWLSTGLYGAEISKHFTF
jgi:hypothetical protein